MSTRVVVNSFPKNLAKMLPGARMGSGEDNVSGQQAFADYLRSKIGSKTNRDVARMVDVSPTTIGNWLVGRLPDLNDVALLGRLADALGVSRREIEDAIRGDQAMRAKAAALKALGDNPIEIVEFALEGQDHLEDWQIEAIQRLLEERRKSKS